MVGVWGCLDLLYNSDCIAKVSARLVWSKFGDYIVLIVGCVAEVIYWLWASLCFLTTHLAWSVAGGDIVLIVGLAVEVTYWLWHPLPLVAAHLAWSIAGGYIVAMEACGGKVTYWLWPLLPSVAAHLNKIWACLKIQRSGYLVVVFSDSDNWVYWTLSRTNWALKSN
jgi:hypothetical protein